MNAVDGVGAVFPAEAGGLLCPAGNDNLDSPILAIARSPGEECRTVHVLMYVYNSRAVGGDGGFHFFQKGRLQRRRSFPTSLPWITGHDEERQPQAYGGPFIEE